MYYLRSMAYSDVFLALATGIRVRSCDLRWNKLADLSYPVPPLDEQKAIVEHVDAVLAKADDVISDKKEQLATLDEYKKSLIFAIIVISENFFDREWTERELNEFLNRQNRNGQKLILPILHNITVSQLQEKYPSIADIQAIDSSKYSCDQIALLFARQLIKRLKSE